MFASYSVARHARADCPQHAEPLLWLASGVRRGWDWVWSVEHGDRATAILAGLARFVQLCGLFLVVLW